ncbi:hypothetical protein [Bacterioplanes sanyensis]|nr:hypothetical protein [Bacterioplanes sanyensis]
MPIAWAMWHWQLAIPKDVAVDATVQPDVPPLSQWLGEYDQNIADFYLLINCHQSDCNADSAWHIHRALGRDAQRLWRWRLTDDASISALPGESVSTAVPPFAGSLALADANGRVVLLFQDLDDAQVLKDLRYVLKRVPKRPDYWPE